MEGVCDAGSHVTVVSSVVFLLFVLFFFLGFFLGSLTRSCCGKLALLASHQTTSSLRPESHHLWVLADQSDINPIGVVVALPCHVVFCGGSV